MVLPNFFPGLTESTDRAAQQEELKRRRMGRQLRPIIQENPQLHEPRGLDVPVFETPDQKKLDQTLYKLDRPKSIRKKVAMEKTAAERVELDTMLQKMDEPTTFEKTVGRTFQRIPSVMRGALSAMGTTAEALNEQVYGKTPTNLVERMAEGAIKGGQEKLKAVEKELE